MVMAVIYDYVIKGTPCTMFSRYVLLVLPIEVDIYILQKGSKKRKN